jgi:hypothetical protein
MTLSTEHLCDRRKYSAGDLNFRLSSGGIPFLLFVAFSPLASFQPTPPAANLCNNCWAIGTPVFTRLGTYQVLRITLGNPGNGYVTGIVLMVVHNSLGQTVEYSTATLQLANGANGTAYLVPFGLAPGEYSSSVFVVTTGGVAISTTIVASFTV